MFETFRSIRFHLLLAALGYIAVGAVMLFIPDQFLAVVCYVIGALLIAYGVIGMLMCWKDRTIRMTKIFIGILTIAVGIFVIAQPKAFTAVLPIIFGLILLLDGILNLRHGIGLKKFGDPGFLSVIIVGVITIVLGAIVLIHPYGTAKFTLRIIGAALIYSGISDFLVLYRMNHARLIYERDNPPEPKKKGQRHKKAKVIDVHAHPVDDDDEEE